MRIIRLKIKPDTKLLISDVSKEQRIVDRGFVEDLYALMRQKGVGIPSDARIKRLSKSIAKKSGVSEISTGIVIRKRVQQLKTMVTTAYFKALTSRKDSIEATRMFLTNFTLLSKKVRQAQCVTCPLMNNCDFGQQYKDAVKDITKVLDPDYAKKAHPDCPVLPDIDRVNQVAGAAEAWAKMMRDAEMAAAAEATDPKAHEPDAKMPADEMKAAIKAQKDADDEGIPEQDDDLENGLDPETSNPVYANTFGNGHADESAYRSSHTGNNIVLMETFIQKVSAGSLAIFELGRKLSLTLTSQKKGKFVPVDPVDRSSTQKTMDKHSDLPKIESHQHGLPTEIFENRADKKTLLKKQNLTRKQKRQLLYLLVDSSASMSGWLGSGNNPNQILTRSALSAILCISVARRVRDDGGMVFCRFFSMSVGRLISARTTDEFDFLISMIAQAAYNGGGTNILASLRHVVADIKSAKDEIAKSEILTVTDCEDSFSVDAVRNTIDSLELNVLDVSGKAFTNQGASAHLRAVATNYYKADETSIDVNKLVKLV